MTQPTPTNNSTAFDLLPIILRHHERTAFTETYGYAGSQGLVLLEGMRFVPHDRPSKTIILLMHPSSTLHTLPIPTALANAGLHIMCCASRYPKNDTALIMEKVALDLGAYVRHAREVLGYDNVVLLGWSGGGSLSLFYQAEAENPTVTATPAGDPVDLIGAGLMPADAVMFIAAHASRARMLADWIDPSVLDEHDPDRRDAALDLYDPANPDQPPYSPAFLDRYRAAQLARVRRITARVRATLDTLRRRDTGEVERGFVVHRTMAEPRWLDPNIDANDRKPRWCFLGDPRTVNNGPAGVARFSTLRSWLSQWSIDDSRADGPASAARISVPLMLIQNSGDDACPDTHAPMIFAATASADKELHVVKGANHYYHDQPELMAEAVAIVVDWLRRKSFHD
jgi:pimeloyl-ACP methyl ester carboxylesterase